MTDRSKKILKVVKYAVLYWFAVSIISVIFFRFVPPPVTPLMLIRNVEQWKKGKEIKLTKHWKGIEKISPQLPAAVIASEDQHFISHHGFDLEAIEKAYKQNSRRKKKIKGASTISQQVAKNVFLWPGRSWIRKGFEVYFTLLIELFWSKERIMEVYLNVAEMGEGIYGVEAAAQTYFKKSCSRLNAPQSALIAAILPNPRKWKPNKPTSYLYARQRWILRNMANLGKVKF